MSKSARLFRLGLHTAAHRANYVWQDPGQYDLRREISYLPPFNLEADRLDQVAIKAGWSEPELSQRRHRLWAWALDMRDSTRNGFAPTTGVYITHTRRPTRWRSMRKISSS